MLEYKRSAMKNAIEEHVANPNYVCRAAMQDRPPDERIKADGSEFAACINGKCFSEVMPFLEELMETLKVLQPRLYEAFLSKLR